METTKNTATLLMSCPDQKGIVAAISGFLFENQANILHADQHQDTETGLFLMRVEWDWRDFGLSESQFMSAFSPLAKKFQMQWRLAFSKSRQRLAIFVSKYLHCLADLLSQYQAGDLSCGVALIVSNHLEARELAEAHRVPFLYVPFDLKLTDPTQKKAEKKAIESRILEALKNHQVDWIVLARYMQILSPQFVSQFEKKIINIHHSFLPAFSGGKPYHQAFERGVKLIGATSHYVTEVLDDGPIIEQDVIRISHRDTVADLGQKGKDLEKVVLSRAVRLHLEDRILVYGKKTVIFG